MLCWLHTPNMHYLLQFSQTRVVVGPNKLMLLEDDPKRYYIFCECSGLGNSQVKLLSAISAASGKSSNPHFFA
jgi:hypothetical protein